MAVVEVKGDIIPNDYQWIYQWLDWEHTCPRDIKDAIENLQPGEQLEVLINSGGGSVAAGQEIYTMLQDVNSVAKVQGMAASAAGVIAMGCRQVYMSRVGAIMIHNVSVSGVAGDYHEMDKASHMLQTLNGCLANAFVAKSGRSMEEVLQIMDRETWLSADEAVSYGFADGILGEKSVSFTNNLFGLRLTEEIMQQVIAEKEQKEAENSKKNEILNDLDMFGI